MNEYRRKELENIMRWAEEEMKDPSFDPFSSSGSRITSKWSEAKKELDANPVIHHDPAFDGRGTGELPGFKFDLD